MNNGQRGFTYVEVLLAMAVLCIALLPVFPALSQAAKNDEYARTRHQAQLYANEMVWAVRDAFANGSSLEAAADTYAAAEMEDSALTCGVWIWNSESEAFTSPGAPDCEINAVMDWSHAYENAGMIVAVVFDDNGNLLGRAVGMIY